MAKSDEVIDKSKVSATKLRSKSESAASLKTQFPTLVATSPAPTEGGRKGVMTPYAKKLAKLTHRWFGRSSGLAKDSMHQWSGGGLVWVLALSNRCPLIITP